MAIPVPSERCKDRQSVTSADKYYIFVSIPASAVGTHASQHGISRTRWAKDFNQVIRAFSHRFLDRVHNKLLGSGTVVQSPPLYMVLVSEAVIGRNVPVVGTARRTFPTRID